MARDACGDALVVLSLSRYLVAARRSSSFADHMRAVR
jgi:hypothetical protein